MGRLNPRATLLLVILMTGGVLAPGAHRIQHAYLDARQSAAEAVLPAQRFDGDGTGLTADTQPVSHLEVVCVLCSGLSVYLSLNRIEGIPAEAIRPLFGQAAAAVHEAVYELLPIRGPPEVCCPAPAARALS